MSVNTPVTPRKSTSACAHGIPCWSARASTRPSRNWLTRVFRIGQLCETCQFCGVLHEHAVARLDQVRGVRVLVAGVRVADEHAAEPAQVLVAADRELVLDLRERAHGLVVALRGRACSGAGNQLFRMASWASRENRDCGMVLFGNGCPGQRIDDRGVETSGQFSLASARCRSSSRRDRSASPRS